MTFLDQAKPPPDPRSIALVGGIHVVIGAALIAGFATPIIDAIVPDRFKATTFKFKPPPPPPDNPVKQPAKQQLSQPVPAPPQRFDFTTTTDFEVKDIPITEFDGTILDPMAGSESGTGTEEITIAKLSTKPKPKPMFTASGPKPKNNPGTWATTKDYPRVDLREGNEGITRFLLVVGANGRVSDCSVTGSSGFGSLDAATCKLVSSRARFDPGQNTSGTKVGGSYTGSIRWVIPK